MGNRIELPAEEVVPPGPYRRLLVELHQQYKAAGRPALRSLSADLTKPTGSAISGNQKSHCAISSATYTVRDAGSGGRYIGRNWATRR